MIMERNGEMTLALLTGEDVAKVLNVSLSFAYQLMRRGEIPTVRLGRSVRVRPEDLYAFIERQVEGPLKFSPN